MNVSVNKRIAIFVGTSRRWILKPQEAVSEFESLHQAQSLVQWLSDFHLLVNWLLLLGILPSDANFWEASQGPSVMAWVGVRR